MSEEETKHDHAEEAYEHEDLSAQGSFCVPVSLLVGG